MLMASFKYNPLHLCCNVSQIGRHDDTLLFLPLHSFLMRLEFQSSELNEKIVFTKLNQLMWVAHSILQAGFDITSMWRFNFEVAFYLGCTKLRTLPNFSRISKQQQHWNSSSIRLMQKSEVSSLTKTLRIGANNQQPFESIPQLYLWMRTCRSQGSIWNCG